MKGYFVTGIGTEIGKTVVSAILVEALKADYWKPVQAGDLHHTDSMKIQAWTKDTQIQIHQETYRLHTPMSPHAAAEIDQLEIKLTDFELPETVNTLIVEGAGGLLVPLNEEACIIDLIEHLGLPVVLVSNNYLGSINHTLLSIEALRHRNIPIAALIFNGVESETSEAIIKKMGNLPKVYHLPQLSKIDQTAIVAEAKKLAPQLQLDLPDSIPHLVEMDQKYVWHPYTQMKTAGPPLPIVKGRKALLIDEQGREYIDAISSWWVNIHGHGNPYIAQKIGEQARQLEHVIFAGFTHPPAVEVAERLLEKLPANQAKIFYSDNGSTAVEIGIKMAIQYFHNQGIRRKRLIAFDQAFHGETFGAMSASGDLSLNTAFADHLFEVKRIPVPSKGNLSASLAALKAQLNQGDVYAFIFEPLVLGAAGMIMYPPEALDQLIALCRKHQVLAIADEVMTGFGRTGRLFASDYLENKPDIICMAKGLTGGTLPLAVTSCTQEVFMGFWSDDKKKTLFHGHSFTANPLGCAAALASFDLFEKVGLSQIKRIEKRHAEFLQFIQNHPSVAEVRMRGTILAVEFKTGEQTSYFNHLRDQLYQFFLDRQLLLRPLGNVIYILPPYCITDEQLNLVYQAIEEALDQFSMKKSLS